METIIDTDNKENVRAMLSESGYSDTAIDYFIDQPDMGSLENADQVSELTGQCGDTMKVYIKMNGDLIEDAKIQVLGCPGAIASAMVAMEMIKGMTIEEARKITDRDIFRRLIEIPDQKQHCIRLSVKAMNKAFDKISPKKE
ncbi:MAG: iron-sulfur cluster assembly scaffold protein [Desulfobacteraceae bacterium]|nr:iron-sulfur cluster assembly scaffold protein [Desulfobacteraceae bacterium]